MQSCLHIERAASARIGSGRSGDVIAGTDGRVLKRFRDPIARRQVEHEFLAQKLARDLGLPTPAVFSITDCDGRLAIVMEQVDGRPMLEHFRWTPWSIIGAFKRLGQLHARINTAPGGELRSQKAFIARHIRAAKLTPDDEAICLEALELLPEGNRLCHGDLHPGNILWSADGPQIIDWGTAHQGCPAGDAARTLLLLGLAPLPQGLRYLTLFRQMAQRAYLSGYLAGGICSQAAIAEWSLPIAAARLAGMRERERPILLSLIERACALRRTKSA